MTSSTFTRTAVALAAIAVFGCAHQYKLTPAPTAPSTAPVAVSPATAPAAATAPSLATYATPDEAAAALDNAARSQNPAAMSAILGPGADSIVYSGDPVADQKARLWFTQTYDTHHDLAGNIDGSKTMEIGQDRWPMPIPIRQDSATGRWSFDVAAGRDEILSRRIGHNELACMQVCRAIVDAQQEYAMTDPDQDGIPAYAERFSSHAGKKDGLYWPVTGGEKLSPLGSLFADAADDGYSTTQAIGPKKPYHGYYYRMLKAQGPSAEGGTRDYHVDNQLIGGFGVVAWPADYGKSGIMTFIVNQAGVIYQRNFGPQTTEIAKAMKAFNPSPEWTRCDPTPTTQFARPH